MGNEKPRSLVGLRGSVHSRGALTQTARGSFGRDDKTRTAANRPRPVDHSIAAPAFHASPIAATLPPAGKHVAYCTSERLGRYTGETFVGLDRLAEDSGLHRRTVQNMIDALVARGHLEVVVGGGRGKGGRKGRSNLYRPKLV